MNETVSDNVWMTNALKIIFATGLPGRATPGIICASKLTESYKEKKEKIRLGHNHLQNREKKEKIEKTQLTISFVIA